MSNGDWIEHVRRTRTAVLRKRAMVIDAIHTYLDSDFDVVEGENSLFVLVKAHDGRSEQELIEAAAPAGARVYPTSQYWYTTPPEDWRYVLIGFAGIPEFKIESGIKTLAKAWGVTFSADSKLRSSLEEDVLSLIEYAIEHDMHYIEMTVDGDRPGEYVTVGGYTAYDPAAGCYHT